ncbi:MAG: hypothetical protein OXG64_00520 [Chloroflexi bacterium]|nr:hypothetical protein [Chloroflexota bacterium]MCY3957253.1 hypothetical protein [Chloroflexota bacterium]
MSLGKVVVIVTPKYLADDDFGFVRVTFPELNIFAHGRDREDALANLKSHFRHFIEALRDTSELEDRLEETGVEWYPLPIAIEKGIPYEDLSPGQPDEDQPSETETSASRPRTLELVLAPAA